MYKRKRAGNTITRKINSTKDTAAKADKNHYISNSYLEGFIPIDTEYFTASFLPFLPPCQHTTRTIPPSALSRFLRHLTAAPASTHKTRFHRKAVSPSQRKRVFIPSEHYVLSESDSAQTWLCQMLCRQFSAGRRPAWEGMSSRPDASVHTVPRPII